MADLWPDPVITQRTVDDYEAALVAIESTESVYKIHALASAALRDGPYHAISRVLDQKNAELRVLREVVKRHAVEGERLTRTERGWPEPFSPITAAHWVWVIPGFGHRWHEEPLDAPTAAHLEQMRSEALGVRALPLWGEKPEDNDSDG